MRNAAEVFERILEASDEVVGQLREHHLAVALARMGEHDPQDMRSTSPAITSDDRSTRSEVDLGFKARLDFHSPKRQCPGVALLLEQPPDAVVADLRRPRKLVEQILMNPLRGQPTGPLFQDPRPPRRSGVSAAEPVGTSKPSTGSAEPAGEIGTLDGFETASDSIRAYRETVSRWIPSLRPISR